MLVKINGKEILTIDEMHYTAMRCIFEKSKVSSEHQKMLEESIDWWSKNSIGLADDTKKELKRIINALIADTDYGRFDRAKELMIRERIEWRKMYKAGLPFISDEMVKVRKH